MELDRKEGFSLYEAELAEKGRVIVHLEEEENSKKAELEMSIANVHLLEALNLKQGMDKDISAHLGNAKLHYENALTLYGDFVIPHYGLFKVAVLEGDYLEALLQLQAYELKSGKDSNYSLLYKMLMTLLGQKGEVASSNIKYIQDIKVEYEPLLSNYRLAETSFDACDYQRTIRHLSICNSLSEKKEIDIDFSTMLYLANIILVLCKEKQKEKLQLDFAATSDVGERMMIAHKLLEMDDSDFENNFLYMDAYIDLKAYSPLLECVMKLKSLPATKKEQEVLSLYERLVSETIIESKYLRAIHGALNHGDKLQSEALYSEAISYYEKANENINFPYFRIKEAEAYYAMGDIDNAIRCCEFYLETGYLHFVEASIFLYRIYRDNDNIEKAISIAFECYKKARMKERGITLRSWILRLNNGYQDLSVDLESNQKKYFFQYLSEK